MGIFGGYTLDIETYKWKYKTGDNTFTLDSKTFIGYWNLTEYTNIGYQYFNWMYKHRIMHDGHDIVYGMLYLY